MQKKIEAVIFDLDGVIVSTDGQHFEAWRAIAQQEGIAFDRRDNDKLRGVSRMESLEILLGDKKDCYTDTQKAALAEQKNTCYKELIQKLGKRNILPGVKQLLCSLREAGVKLAIGSASKNTETILQKIGLKDAFEVVVTGNDIQRSKPDPEVYLLAATRLGLSPENCLVVEDAHAGVDAAATAGMRTLGVGSAASYGKATAGRPDLAGLTYAQLRKMFGA